MWNEMPKCSICNKVEPFELARKGDWMFTPFLKEKGANYAFCSKGCMKEAQEIMEAE